MNLVSNQAISRSFNSSILTKILEIRLLTCFPLFEMTCLDFSSEIFHLESSVGVPFEDSVDICIFNVVWKCCLEVSGRDTEWERPPRCCEPSVCDDPPRSRGGSDPSPGGRPSTPSARRVGNQRQFIRQGRQGLTCRAGVARS